MSHSPLTDLKFNQSIKSKSHGIDGVLRCLDSLDFSLRSHYFPLFLNNYYHPSFTWYIHAPQGVNSFSKFFLCNCIFHIIEAFMILTEPVASFISLSFLSVHSHLSNFSALLQLSQMLSLFGNDSARQGHRLTVTPHDSLHSWSVYLMCLTKFKKS